VPQRRKKLKGPDAIIEKREIIAARGTTPKGGTSPEAGGNTKIGRRTQISLKEYTSRKESVEGQKTISLTIGAKNRDQPIRRVGKVGGQKEVGEGGSGGGSGISTQNEIALTHGQHKPRPK